MPGTMMAQSGVNETVDVFVIDDAAQNFNFGIREASRESKVNRLKSK